MTRAARDGCSTSPDGREVARIGFGGWVAVGLIKAYGLLLSPLIGRNCRYLPTCSAYGEEAIRRYGLWYGGWMTLARLLRCQPFGASGHDPVPAVRDSRAGPLTPWRAARWTGAHIPAATRLDR